MARAVEDVAFRQDINGINFVEEECKWYRKDYIFVYKSIIYYYSI